RPAGPGAPRAPARRDHLPGPSPRRQRAGPQRGRLAHRPRARGAAGRRGPRPADGRSRGAPGPAGRAGGQDGRLPARLPLQRRPHGPGRLRQPRRRPARPRRRRGDRRPRRGRRADRAGDVPALARVPGAALVIDAYLTSPGYEGALAGELGGAGGPRWPAVVSTVPSPDPDTLRARARARARARDSEDVRPRGSAGARGSDSQDLSVDPSTSTSTSTSTKSEAPDPIWGRQRIPGATQVRGESVRDLAEAAYAIVESSIDAAEGSFVLH